MKALMAEWQAWAFLSACFAALTAVFGKIGVADIDSNFATLLRTVVIIAVAAGIVAVTGAAQPLASIPRRTYIFLALSGAATGASWLCYYRALKMGPAAGVAPIDKLSVVMVAIFSVAFLGEHLAVKGWIGIALITLGAVLVAL